MKLKLGVVIVVGERTSLVWYILKIKYITLSPMFNKNFPPFVAWMTIIRVTEQLILMFCATAEQPNISKGNYRSIDAFSNISKICQRCLYNQIQTFFDEFLSKYQCGFCQGFNAQHCLVSLIKKWRECVQNGRAFGAHMRKPLKLLTVYMMTF